MKQSERARKVCLKCGAKNPNAIAACSCGGQEFKEPQQYANRLDVKTLNRLHAEVDEIRKNYRARP